TYATQQVGGKELTRAKESNFIHSLQGKMAGLTITPNSSGAGGGSSKIILRGQTSMLGNNQPLIVLDGIPMSQGLSGQTSEVVVSGGRDGGDILSTINPDDIASMSVLKGPNAAALYGSAANNGVIIINTKGGREGKIRVDVSSNLTLETPLFTISRQADFAPEIIGDQLALNGWGNPVGQITDEQIARYPYLTRDAKNRVNDFFKVGQTYNNSIALSGGTEHTTSYFSYGNTVQKGLMERNRFIRHNLLFKETFNVFNNKLKIDLSLNYITQKTENRPVIGKVFNPLTGLYRMPAAVDTRYFSENRTHEATEDDRMVKLGSKNLIGEQIQTWPFGGDAWVNNPYFLQDAIDDSDRRDRILVNVTAKYEIIKGLDLQARVSLDKNIGSGYNYRIASIWTDQVQTGSAFYYSGENSSRDIYSDYLLTYNKEFKNISFNATVGTSFKRTQSSNSGINKWNDSTFIYPNIAWPGYGNVSGNSKDFLLNATASGVNSNWETAVFATAQVGFWDKAYVDVSFRNDWSKAFQQFTDDEGGYKSFAYWSVGANVLLDQFFPRKLPNVTQMKIRGSYSVVGNSIPLNNYNSQTLDPISGSVSARPASFDNPKPETTQGIEVGFDGIFFKNKFDLDLTFYQNTMSNQYLRITTASGQSKPINSGKVRNRGLEFTANYHMKFGRDFRWTTGINLAYNDNKILETYKPSDGGDVQIVVGASSLAIQSKYKVGGSYGDLYGKDFVRDPNTGLIQVNSNGQPQIGATYDKFIGNTTAKFTFGWNNTLSWKNFSFYMLIDGKVGGKVLCLTEAEMDFYGLSQRTADARLSGETVVWNGVDVAAVTLPDGQKVPAKAYYEAVGGNQMDCAYDASNIRFREISLGYTFYDLLGVSKNLTISLVGRNLGFIYKKSPVDPDISMTAGNNFGGVESYALPTTRSYGFNVKVTF
ncbi:MAG: SusC/RagA family TonB-linked outer membrane protein, partial [Bacteroidales bacterium]